jgi:VWFA-related protein
MKISSLFHAAFLTAALLLTHTDDALSQRRFPYRLDLDSRSLDTLHTPDATSPLHRYRITAWGTYSMWEDTLNSSVDPIWIYSFPAEEWAKPEWRIFPEGYPIYVGDDRMLNSHGLRINDLPMPKQPLVGEHRYTMIVQGDGRPISASIVDWNFKGLTRRDAHDNNSGTLHLLIEELPITTMEICAIDSSRFPLIRLSLQVHRDSVRYEDFADKLAVIENGMPVRIDSIDCSTRTMPVSVAMVFDRSGSMSEAFGLSTRMNEVRTAGKRFVDKLAGIDEAAVYSFSLTTTLDQNWTSSKPPLKAAIDRLQPDGWTAMNDAVLRAINDVQGRPADRKKAIVVLSDGEDNRSTVKSIRTVIDRARQAHIPVFAIGLLLDNDDSLRLLASETGGRYFSIRDASAMDSAFASIADVVLEKGCCSVYYTSPDSRRDGGFRQVTANVAFQNDTLLARYTGYHAPGRTSSVDAPEESSAGSGIISIAPNPLHESGTLRLMLPKRSQVSIVLLDVAGRVVSTVYDGELPAGENLREFDTEGLPAGRYFLRLAMPGESSLYPVVIAR